MRQPIFVRKLRAGEREVIEEELRTSEAFTLRRAQIVLASARGEWVPRIAEQLACGEQTVRNAIHAFNARGIGALQAGSSRPHTIRVAIDEVGAERLRALLHQSPRTFGKPTSIWTLELAAEVSFAEGITAEQVSDETIRQTIQRLGIGWKRAKHWITSPDPEYARKKSARDRLIRLAMTHPEWALGFQDEVWWSRLAVPGLHAWAEDDQPLRLVEQAVAKNDPDPKALACYGLLVRWATAGQAWQQQAWLRFVDGRPVSSITTQFLDWCCTKLQAARKTALLLVWDNAAWHVSAEVRAWIDAHNQQVKQAGAGVRIVNCYLPVKSPWLNPIEPMWLHAKRRVVEPARLLSAADLIDRVCAALDCPHERHLAIPHKVA